MKIKNNVNNCNTDVKIKRNKMLV